MKGILALGFAAIFLVGLNPCTAQGSKPNEQRIKDEISLARNLAVDFGFVKLANEVLEELLKVKGLPDNLRNSIKIEKLLLSIYNALVEPELIDKINKMREPLLGLQTLMDKNRATDMGIQVRVKYGEYAIRFCQLVLEHIKQENLTGDSKETVRKEGEEIARSSIRALNDAKAYLEGKGQKTALAKAWFLLCNFKMTTAFFSPNKEERDIWLDKAIQELENFIFHWGVEKPIGIKALLLTARCNEEKGDYSTAEYIYTSQKDELWTLLTNDEIEIPPAVIPVVAKIMEDAYHQSLRLLMEQKGDLELVIELGREMLDHVNQLEIDLAMPEGYGALYYLVYALFETGEYKEALKKAMDGAKACGNRLLGKKFKNIIEMIVREIDESLLNPDIIFQVATAKYNRGDYNECITFSKKGLGSLQTTQDKGNFGLKLFCLMGKCYVAMERRIEATYAYGEGCEIFNDFRPGDTKYADALEMASIRCKNNADKVYRNSNRAPSMRPLLDYGSRIYKAHTKDPGRIIIGEMKALLGANKFSAVTAKFKELKKEYSSYEQGLSILVEVEYEKAKASGSFRSVKQKAKNYLVDYLTANPHVAGDQMESRKNAKLQVNFILGQVAYKEAIGNTKLGINPKPAEWDRVIKIFTPFPEAYPGQNSFLAYGYYAMGRAYREKGDLPKAEVEFAKLKKLKKRGQMVIALSMQIFLGHQEIIVELGSQKNPNKAQVKKALNKALDFGRVYMKDNPQPDWNIMKKMQDYRIRLGDVDGVLDMHAKLENIFGKSATFKNQLIKWRIPRVVEFLIDQREFSRAAPLVEKMLNRKSYPQNVRWNAVRFYSGWLEVVKGEVKEVHGHGPLKKVYEKSAAGDSLAEMIYKPYQSADAKFTQGWYRVVAQLSYIYLQAGAEDASLFDKAKSFVRLVKGAGTFDKIVKFPRLSPMEEKEMNAITDPEEKKKLAAKYEAERHDLLKIFNYLASKLGL